ncbi:hypothetical protein NDU88_001323 [Pleurodeles waltl]|uniref:Uncharacterized protein n=1 Tax=Pleurodeles waltl TaxID=8319 RepID=A0AAV7MK62_PLEWA|nr:hypothetical protein NDU88_001323 [Pleurodeles waltl]
MEAPCDGIAEHPTLSQGYQDHGGTRECSASVLVVHRTIGNQFEWEGVKNNGSTDAEEDGGWRAAGRGWKEDRDQRIAGTDREEDGVQKTEIGRKVQCRKEKRWGPEEPHWRTRGKMATDTAGWNQNHGREARTRQQPRREALWMWGPQLDHRALAPGKYTAMAQ